MARISKELFIEGGKKVLKGGKKVLDVGAKYGPKIIAFMGTVDVGVKTLKGMREGKVPYREERYNHYKTKLLPKLDNQNRDELYRYTLEIEQFIQQIINEEKEDMGVKKLIHEKRIKKWNDILMQIQDKISTLDYLEFVKIYNNPNYQSEYFKGFEGHVENFKKLNNGGKNDDLLKYIAEKTSRNIDQIKKDFSL